MISDGLLACGILLLAFAAVRKIRKDRKRGACCGCSASCASQKSCTNREKQYIMRDKNKLHSRRNEHE